MKNLAKILSVITTIGLIFCLSGCRKSESEYKSAISKHMSEQHGTKYIDAYDYFDIDDDGNAEAQITVTVKVGRTGTMEMHNKISVDEDCNIYSCSFCDWG